MFCSYSDIKWKYFVSHEQGSANMKILPNNDIQYFYYLKSYTNYEYWYWYLYRYLKSDELYIEPTFELVRKHKLKLNDVIH